MTDQLKKILYIIGIFLGAALLVLAIIFGLKYRPAGVVELEFWSIYDNSDIYDGFIRDFNREYPYIKIKYSKKTFDSYENELIDALATPGKGPDIFVINDTWLPKYKNKLIPLPQNKNTMFLKDYQDTFVDVAVQDFVSDNQIYAIPFFVDTLALYYNKDYFNTAGIAEPPRTWEEFMDDVSLLTKKDEYNNIIRAGATIGTAKNINRSTDILGLLMLQNGTKMVDDGKRNATFDASVSKDNKAFEAGKDALRFYTGFADSQKPFYTWNPDLDYSIDMFYQGRAAMMFNYAYHFKTIKAKSPHLNFAVAPMPQLSNRTNDINYANYWAAAVSKKSQKSKYAWQFLVWMSKKENLQKYVELTNEPVSRRDLIPWQRINPEIGIFADQALSAQSWYQVDNSAIETIFADMIDNVVMGRATPENAIRTAAKQVTILMRK